MKELFSQTLIVAYGVVGILGLLAYWPTIKDLHYHKKPSANIWSYILWTLTTGITFLYSIFILPDLLFRIISGATFAACVIVLLLSIKLKIYNMPEKEGSFKPEESDAGPKEGDIKIINGKKWRYEKSRYTLRQFYSHSTPEMGPGPGWDFKTRLLDKEYTMKKFGRTFSIKEVFHPDTLPDLPIYDWEPVHEK